MCILEKEVGNQESEFYFGGYGSFDEFAHECSAVYKKTHKSVSLVFVMPYLDATHKSNLIDFSKYDKTIYPNLENVPLRFAISKRNEYMAKHADVAIVYVTHNVGGAYKAMEYACGCGTIVFNIAT